MGDGLEEARYREREGQAALALVRGCAISTASVLLTATSEDEVNMWIKGLTWLMEDTLQAATPLQIER